MLSRVHSLTVPPEIGLPGPVYNPALPPQLKQKSKKLIRLPSVNGTGTLGAGPKRVYLDIQSKPPNVAYPPRPVPGSVADLDHVMKHCNFSKGKVSRVAFYHVASLTWSL